MLFKERIHVTLLIKMVPLVTVFIKHLRDAFAHKVHFIFIIYENWWLVL